MSRRDLERLVADVQQNPDLFQRLREWAQERGYEVTEEELSELRESHRELSDDELEQAAGGDDGWGTGTGGGTGGTGGTTGGGG